MKKRIYIIYTYNEVLEEIHIKVASTSVEEILNAWLIMGKENVSVIHKNGGLHLSAIKDAYLGFCSLHLRTRYAISATEKN